MTLRKRTNTAAKKPKGKPRTRSTRKSSENSAVADGMTRLIKKFRGRRVVVIGDLMLDHYIWGTVNRISPEAPVPVVSVSKESTHLGGAANVAQNIVSLGGKAELFGVVGEDEFGRRLIREMNRVGIGIGGVIIDRSRPTTKKTRVLAHNQQVVRFDVEEKEGLSEKVEKNLLEKITNAISRADSILISDYAKGVVTGGLMKGIRKVSSREKTFTIVDPKVSNMSFFQGVDIITPNAGEAVGAVGLGEVTLPNIIKAGEALLERLACRAVLITRGDQGISLFERERKAIHIPAVAREVYDVTGAGDTFIGTLALGISSGASLKDSAALANCAAGIAVGTVGTETVSHRDLSLFLKEHGH